MWEISGTWESKKRDGMRNRARGSFIAALNIASQLGWESRRCWYQVVYHLINQLILDTKQHVPMLRSLWTTNFIFTFHHQIPPKGKYLPALPPAFFLPSNSNHKLLIQFSSHYWFPTFKTFPQLSLKPCCTVKQAQAMEIYRNIVVALLHWSFLNWDLVLPLKILLSIQPPLVKSFYFFITHKLWRLAKKVEDRKTQKQESWEKIQFLFSGNGFRADMSCSTLASQFCWMSQFYFTSATVTHDNTVDVFNT